MEFDCLQMDPNLAAEKLAAAEKQIKRYRHPGQALQNLRDAYRALEKGTPVISLAQAISAGGWDASGRPNLAVARSDRRHVRYQIQGSDARGSLVFRSDERGVAGWSWTDLPRKSKLRRSVPLRHFSSVPNYHGVAVAVVPLVPPDVVEKAGNPSLAKCFTLFEADWEDIPIDPALIRHLGGDLYAVLATWDLTDLERHVLASLVEAR